jgi:ribonuclease Y
MHVCAGGTARYTHIVEILTLAHDLAKKIEAEMSYPGTVKVHVARESRAVDYAK